MGQGEVYEYLKKFHNSPTNPAKCVEISIKLGVNMSSTTAACKKLRQIGFIKFEWKPPNEYVYWVENEK